MEKNECGVIRDLIPLYIDGVCSDESKMMVESHLETCPDCRRIIDGMKDTGDIQSVRLEANEVVKSRAKAERVAASGVLGMILSGIYMLAAMICLIVNIATERRLSWFFIVLAALMTAASLTSTPLAARKNRLAYTLVSFIISVSLLLFVCALYSSNTSWLGVAITATVFGVSVVFLPPVLKSLNLPEPVCRMKGLICMLWDTAWYTAMMFAIKQLAAGFNVRIALIISLFGIGYAWVMFLVIRYLPFNKPIRAAVAVFITGIVEVLTNGVVEWAIFGRFGLRIVNVNLLSWGENYMVNNANIDAVFLLGCIAAAVILTVIGINIEKKKRNGGN